MKLLIMQFNENITRHKKERKLKINGLQPFQFKGRAEATVWMAGRMFNRSSSPQIPVLPSPSDGKSRARFLPSPITTGIRRVRPT
jgi:hypothetical protein